MGPKPSKLEKKDKVLSNQHKGDSGSRYCNYIKLHAHIMYTTFAFDAIGEMFFFVDSFRFMIHA